jgi:hypothetical protein
MMRRRMEEVYDQDPRRIGLQIPRAAEEEARPLGMTPRRRSDGGERIAVKLAAALESTLIEVEPALAFDHAA